MREPEGAATGAEDDERASADVKERIRVAALRLFAERGFHAVSVRHICRLADTTLPMVYYYYGSKKGLHDALLEEAIERRVHSLQAAKQYQGDVVDRLRVILEAWAAPDEANLPREVQMFYVRELTGVGAGLRAESLDRLDRELRRALRAVLDDGIAAGQFRPVNTSLVVLAMIGIVNTFRRRMVRGGNVTLEDGIQQATETFVEGLLTMEARTARGTGGASTNA